jgi:hypothetical protein
VIRKKVFRVWLLIMAAESVSGIFRRLFVEPLLGDMPSRQTGVLLGSAFIVLITVLNIRSMELVSPGQQLKAGGLWVVLTLVFELGLGLLTGASWERMLSDYDPRQGGLMIFGLLFMLFSPFLISKFNQKRLS